MNVVPTNSFKIVCMFHYKDVVSKSMRSYVIYKYRCKCCSSEYVGSTIHTLGIRACEHLGISPRIHIPLNKPKKSTVRKYALCCGSLPSLENFSFLASVSCGVFRLLESIYAHKGCPDLNNTLSAEPLRVLTR